MQNTHNGIHPIEALLLVAVATAWAVWQIARLLLVPLLALLLTLAGWKPSRPAAAAVTAVSEAPSVTPEPPCSAAITVPAVTPCGVSHTSRPALASPAAAPAVVLACAPEPMAIASPPLADLTVAELRRLARAAGLPRALSRSGRRAQLLEALAAA